jgi:hypothetical protein
MMKSNHLRHSSAHNFLDRIPSNSTASDPRRKPVRAALRAVGPQTHLGRRFGVLSRAHTNESKPAMTAR